MNSWTNHIQLPSNVFNHQLLQKVKNYKLNWMGFYEKIKINYHCYIEYYIKNSHKIVFNWLLIFMKCFWVKIICFEKIKVGQSFHTQKLNAYPNIEKLWNCGHPRSSRLSATVSQDALTHICGRSIVHRTPCNIEIFFQNVHFVT